MLKNPIDIDRVDIEDRDEVVSAVRRLYRENRAEDAKMLIGCLPEPGVDTLLGSALTALYAHGKLPEMVHAVTTGAASCPWSKFAELSAGYDGEVTAELKIVGGTWWMWLPAKTIGWFRGSRGWLYTELPKVACGSITKLEDFGLVKPKEGPIIGDRGHWGETSEDRRREVARLERISQPIRFPAIRGRSMLNTDDILSIQPLTAQNPNGNTAEGLAFSIFEPLQHGVDAALIDGLNDISDRVYEEMMRAPAQTGLWETNRIIPENITQGQRDYLRETGVLIPSSLAESLSDTDEGVPVGIFPSDYDIPPIGWGVQEMLTPDILRDSMGRLGRDGVEEVLADEGVPPVVDVGLDTEARVDGDVKDPEARVPR